MNYSLKIWKKIRFFTWWKNTNSFAASVKNSLPIIPNLNNCPSNKWLGVKKEKIKKKHIESLFVWGNEVNDWFRVSKDHCQWRNSIKLMTILISTESKIDPTFHSRMKHHYAGCWLQHQDHHLRCEMWPQTFLERHLRFGPWPLPQGPLTPHGPAEPPPPSPRVWATYRTWFSRKCMYR